MPSSICCPSFRSSLDIDHNWLSLDLIGYSDAKILELVSIYEEQFDALQKQFADDVRFDERPDIMKKTESSHRNYFYIRYPKIKELERREAENVRSIRAASTQ